MPADSDPQSRARDADAALGRLLRALADDGRRVLLDRLRDRPGLTLGELAAGAAGSRQAVSKHLAVLEAAGLVVPLWRGREKLHYLDPAPLQALPARWVTATARGHAAARAALAKARAAPAEGAPSGDVASLLRARPAPALDGRAVADAAALDAARRYAEGTAVAMRALIDALDETAARTAPAGGGFSLAEHLWHLADIEELGWSVRMERVLAEARPRLAGVDGDRLAVERDYARRPWRGAARRFVTRRRRTLAALARFDAATLARPVVFGGRATRAGDVLAALVAHDLEHRVAMAALWTSTTKESRR